jgi:hypothetical protein
MGISAARQWHDKRCDPRLLQQYIELAVRLVVVE